MSKVKKNKNSFNWKKTILILLFIIIITLTSLWIFGIFDMHNFPYKDLKFFKKAINDNDASHFKEIIFNPDDKKIIVKTVTKASSFTVISGSTLISKMSNYLQGIENDSNWDFETSFSKLKGFVDSENLKINEWSSINEFNILNRIFYALMLILRLTPFVFFSILIYYLIKGKGSMMGQGTSGIMSSKSQAQRIISQKSFKNIAGMEEAKQEVEEIVDFLKSPKKYKAAGARVPKGILLVGPPGTGKTLLAKAVAGESQVPFYFIAASNFVELFSGLGAKRARDVFKEMRKNAPAILFIDELDAIGRKRSSFAGNDEKEQTLNQILVEMDGMEETSGVLVMAATNRRDILDPALQRPGRFDRIITVNLPDVKEREAILKLHSKGKRISSDIDFKNIAKRTPRYSGAELENVINESILLSVREKTDVITLLQIDEAIDRVLAGPSKKHRVITKEENKLVAIHEAGHAVVGLKLQHADIVQKITIIPRGEAGGYTLMTPAKELFNYSKSQLISKITGLLGGRAAEKIFIGEEEISTGSSNDIQRATGIAKEMVTKYGMSELGPIAYEKSSTVDVLNQNRAPSENSYSEFLAEKIDEAVRKLILEAEKKAIDVIKQNKKLHTLITEELIEKETIILEEINYINKYLKRPIKKIKPSNSSKKTKSILKDIISEIQEEKISSNSSKKTKLISKNIINKTKKNSKTEEDKKTSKNIKKTKEKN